MRCNCALVLGGGALRANGRLQLHRNWTTSLPPPAQVLRQSPGSRGFGNLVEVSAAFSTNTFVIPLAKYPTASKIVIRCVAHVGTESTMMAKQMGKGRVVAFGAGSALQNQALNSRIINHSSGRVVAANTNLLMNLGHWLTGSDAAQ